MFQVGKNTIQVGQLKSILRQLNHLSSKSIIWDAHYTTNQRCYTDLADRKNKVNSISGLSLTSVGANGKLQKIKTRRLKAEGRKRRDESILDTEKKRWQVFVKYFLAK